MAKKTTSSDDQAPNATSRCNTQDKEEEAKNHTCHQSSSSSLSSTSTSTSASSTTTTISTTASSSSTTSTASSSSSSAAAAADVAVGSSENVQPRTTTTSSSSGTMISSSSPIKIFGDYTLVSDDEDSEDEEEVDDDEDIEAANHETTNRQQIRGHHGELADDDDVDEDDDDDQDDEDQDDNDDQLEVDQEDDNEIEYIGEGGETNPDKFITESKEQHHQQSQSQQQQHQQKQQSSPLRSQQQLQHLSHQHHIQLLMNALEKLDPDKNGLALVPKEITSSTLTTRLKGVCKINRIIDHSNDLCHSFTEVGAQAKYQESTDKFRNWILRNKIIEHIFGPNCHVEIIKQSHTILNFVAHSLNDDHVNVIWSASLLKHCGRQVLDLLTSLVRFMRTGPVLHLYWLVKNLSIEEHSEHTLLLTSHILRYIWSHSPCINQVQFASFQKTRHRQQQHLNQQRQQHQQLNTNQTGDRDSPQLHYTQNQSTNIPTSHNSLSLAPKNKNGQSQFHSQNQRDGQHSPIRQSRQLRISNIGVGNETNTMAGTSDTNSSTVTTSSAPSSNVALTGDQYHWLATCMFSNSNNEELNERSVSSRSTTESVDMDKDLQQSLLDAIRGVTQQQQHQRASNSPVGETIAKGGDENHQPADDMKRNVVDHILKSISDSSQTTSHQKESSGDDMLAQTSDMKPPPSGSGSTTNEREWLSQLWRDQGDFLDNTSDVSACCSEEKNMDDFADEVAQELTQDENEYDVNQVSQNPSHKSDDIYGHTNPRALNPSSNLSPSRPNIINVDHKTEALTLNESTSSRDSDTRFRLSLDQNVDQSNESITQYKELKKTSCSLSNVTFTLLGDDDFNGLSEYNLANLCEPGKTLLWDLLQDGKIEHLAANLNVEMENVLVNLVMSFGDRFIRYRFIEACLENLSAGTSVIISLRLLPKLMSFNTLTRNLSIPAINETHTLVLWAEREYNMSENFFKNLVDYYEQRQILLDALITTDQSGQKIIFGQHKYLEEQLDQQSKGYIFTHIDKIITRMSFLTFIYSKPFSPENMKLSREQMDQLWDCLASDINPRCSDVLFQWIYQQAVGEDFHGVNDELLDYVLKHKLPTLDPRNFRLRGLKLLEQLLWIRQDYECCHGLEHPATRLLWNIGLHAHDDEVGMAAIRILNHFYIYTNHQKSTKCDKGINFMNHCMDQLESTLSSLTRQDEESKNVAQLLDIMQKVILLIRTHLEVFKAHWSFYLRTLQLNNEADLISHRLNAYEVKLTMTVRLSCQAASSMHKTTIEMQAGDFIGELRAEILRWWFTHVDRTFLEQAAAMSPSISPSSSTSSHVPTTNQSNHEVERIRFRSKSNVSSLKPFTEYLLANHRSLRLLSHNQEIPFEWDERQINELDFKDGTNIYILSDIKSTNTEPTDDLASNQSNDSTQPAYLPKTEIPSILLLRQEYFERLMEADRFLGSFQHDNLDFTNRAKALSRRVWEIIQILPTCPHYKADLRRCGLPDDNWRLKTTQCSSLLSAEYPQRLLYSLQIIDILRSSHDNPNWGAVFIKKGGLADIFDVFMSQKLLPAEHEEWNDWLQECLAYLLKLLFQFGTKPLQSMAHDSSSSSSSSKMSTSTCSNRTMISGATSIKRIRRNRTRLLASAEERLAIPQFSEELLKLLSNTDVIFAKLIRILRSSAMCRSQSDHYYYVTMSSRAMIIHHIMSFLSSWCKSDLKFPKFSIADHEQLLKALILEDTDASTRREACNGFFKLHHACSTKSINTSIDSINSTMNSPLDSSTETSGFQSCVFKEPTNWALSTDLLKCLIKFLPIAEDMTPPKPIRNYVSENEYIKELNSPGCKDYFWLTCRLIDSPATTNLYSDKASASNESKSSDTLSIADEPSGSTQLLHAAKPDDRLAASPNPSPINLFQLCEYLVIAIRKRKTYETRDFSVEDDTLRGMLMMMVMALRRDPSYRYTDNAHEFIHELYEYLFAPPTQCQRYMPKCKSPATRSTAFDLMLALVERCPKNYFGLLELLLFEQHNSVVKGTYPSDYWPHDDCRSEVGFVGLVNLGATCYLATCMQHLFMIPNLRYAILSIEDTGSIRHGEIIRELQKIFTFMLESERKAYNPRNFCKVYTMDNHPLNIAEQTDMTEFLTDLMTKLEESSPELRQIIKGLFSGTLSNNVVSLDCPHISRTTEEFYTLRVQVADMRNLNDSLDELTVKDTLEGDNMYTCSTCEKKVRAEKRACIVKLPRILCFNTMRYTFNMATMTKEKVNTHFSFPLKLDMADYLEANLMKRQQSSSSTASCSSKESSDDSPLNDKRSPSDCQQKACRADSKSPENSSQTPGDSPGAGDDQKEQDIETIYELIGVTVHTGNADGGHYYCFIRDCEDQSSDKPRWYLFNDAEVKPFDDSHIGAECYGGELTTKSYDAINDRFMDFSIEKTNSAYMLFYKRVDYQFKSRSVALRYLESDTQRDIRRPMSQPDKQQEHDGTVGMDTDSKTPSPDDQSQELTVESSCAEVDKSLNSSGDLSMSPEFDFNELCQRTYEDFELPKYLANWIWYDNMKFARDKNVFEHNYFNFMWQICANLPRTINQIPEHLTIGDQSSSASFHVSEDALAIRTVHLAIAFVLGVLMNSRERPNLSNWTELIRKQFNSSKAACDWLTHLIDDEETWLKQMLLKCPIEMVRQLFQRLCNDLTGPKQHKKLRLIR